MCERGVWQVPATSLGSSPDQAWSGLLAPTYLKLDSQLADVRPLRLGVLRLQRATPPAEANQAHQAEPSQRHGRWLGNVPHRKAQVQVGGVGQNRSTNARCARWRRGIKIRRIKVYKELKRVLRGTVSCEVR